MKQILIIGAGYTGLAAAYELARAGHKVKILEEAKDPGGLAGSFEVSPQHRLEKFYHHWFTSDTEIFALIAELGLEDRIRTLSSRTGLFFSNSIFRLTSPLDLLTFSPLPIWDRVRTGAMALYARSITQWQPLESISAADWIRKVAGRRSFDVIWKPLLMGKFGDYWDQVSAVWFWNKLKLRGGSRDKSGNETLRYFEGGFAALTKALCEKLQSFGVEFEFGTQVLEIRAVDGKLESVETSKGSFRADEVLATVPLPEFLKITPALPMSVRERAAQIQFLGNVCLILRLRYSLSSTYWLNVADPSFPYVGIIEHTNFDTPANYGGEHIAYMSKYLPTSAPLYQMSDPEVLEFSIPFLKKMFPKFDEREWLLGYFVWRAPYSQPITGLHYSASIPALKTPIEHVWLATMAQIYPEDRGTNYAIQSGREAARAMMSHSPMNL